MQSFFVLGAAAVGMANAMNVPRNYYGDNSTSTEEMTTSTVYATNVHTVTQCPPEVVDCPVGHVTTETIAVYTTYCPVTAVITVPSGYTKPVEVTKPVETVTKPAETKPVYTKPTDTTEEMTTSTIYTTNVHTVTKCPPEVPDCPVGHVTTETVAISTTVCPVTEVHPKPTTEEKPTEPKPTKPVETHPVPVHPPHYGNNTSTQWTTSTIYTTNVNTVTKCPPEVPNCPVGHTTTETYAVSTTVCPVTETHPVETHPVVVPSKPVETHPVVPEPSKPAETHPVVPVPEPSKPAETHPVVPVPEPSKPVETHPVVPEPSKPAETHPVVPVPEPSKPAETHPVVPVPEPSKPAETHPVVVPEPSKPVEPVPTTPVPETPVVTGAAGRMGLDVAAIVAGAAVFLL